MTATEGFYDSADRRNTRVGLFAVPASVAKFLIGSVPAVTGETLAVARIVFGLSILFFWRALSPDSLASVAREGPRYSFSKLIDQSGLLTILSSNPSARFVVYWVVTALLIALVVGLFSRVLYPVLVGLFWLVALLKNEGHFITPLLLAMAATIPVPWSDRWSIDALLRRQSPPPVATPFYGYGIWLLGLTIGLTYAAAGLSKLIITDGAWLWETGARNGFILDLRSAVTDWGMILTNNYWLALAASIVSALGQAVYVYASFTRSAAVKYGICFFIAIPFLIGLVLFMGLFWWPWFVLVLILYLPWRRIDRMIAGKASVAPFIGSTRINAHRYWFLTATTLLIGLHVYAVATRTEYEPLYSSYPMYADRMLAGSEYESKFWSRYKTYDRHYKVTIEVVGTDKASNSIVTKNLDSQYYATSWLGGYSLWRSELSRLSPHDTLKAAAAGTPVSPSRCSLLKKIASNYAPVGFAGSAMRFAKRYYDLVDGQIAWTPVTTWVEIDLAGAPNCPYREVRSLLPL